MVTESDVRNALAQVKDPELNQSIVELGMVRDLRITDGRVVFKLALTALGCPFKERIVGDAKQAVQALEGIKAVDVHLAEMTANEKAALSKKDAPKSMVEKLNDIKHVIAIMSGKGGVGKSLVTGLLAISMRHMGHKVGVLDADITGPSIPKMFFKDGARPGFSPMALLPPKTQTGICIMSIKSSAPK
jgi:ATP-binding protein involved in chromosome partitioning